MFYGVLICICFPFVQVCSKFATPTRWSDASTTLTDHHAISTPSCAYTGNRTEQYGGHFGLRNWMPLRHFELCNWVPLRHFELCNWMPLRHFELCNWMPLRHFELCNWMPLRHFEWRHYRAWIWRNVTEWRRAIFLRVYRVIQLRVKPCICVTLLRAAAPSFSKISHRTPPFWIMLLLQSRQFEWGHHCRVGILNYVTIAESAFWSTSLSQSRHFELCHYRRVGILSGVSFADCLFWMTSLLQICHFE